MSSEISLLQPLGYQKNKSCGYCKNASGTSSYYMSCKNMRLDHYQELMDRGWRRSGTLYYKPDLTRSCCPHYTIRLDAGGLETKREQRQAINRLNSYVLGLEYKRKVAMLCPVSRETKRQKRDTFDLLNSVHLAQYDTVKRPMDRNSKKPIEPAHRLEVSLEPDSCTKEKHKIMLKYQTEIHKDPPSRWKEASFKRFLCSGISRQTPKVNGKTQKLGSYHQCYRLDGKLVAVGVLDLLPHAVSSVYLFYDPEYGHWDWGKVSALHEIALALEGGYQYYYMGFYIHSCIKMRYKGKFSPSYLLDPEVLDWNLFDDDYRKKLDERKYVSPSHDSKVEAQPDSSSAVNGDAEKSPKENDSTSIDLADENESKVEDQPCIEVDADDSEADDSEIPEGSLFDYNIPGVLTKKEVAKLDLSHWKLMVRNALIDLEDLRGWEESELDDSGSIKGIAAELIAATGPRLLEHSALNIFG